MTPDTGNLATISFPESGFTAKFVQIGEVERTIEALEASCLETQDEKEYIPGDLAEVSVLECEFFWNSAVEPPDAGELDTPVITFPAPPAETAGGSEGTPMYYTGSGFFLNKLLPMMKNGELSKGKAKFQFDGRGTKLTVTPGTLGT